jgi:hypothetical protein
MGSNWTDNDVAAGRSLLKDEMMVRNKRTKFALASAIALVLTIVYAQSSYCCSVVGQFRLFLFINKCH